MKHSKALVVFSGGQDSTTCLFWAQNRYSYVEAVTFFYEQNHQVELKQAQLICKKLNIPQKVINFSVKNLTTSSLLDSKIKMSFSEKKIPNTLVEGRNILMFTYATIYAKNKNIDHLVTGVCETDNSGYPDCREQFVVSLEKTLKLGLDFDIEIKTPLIKMNKAQIFELAKKEGCLELILEDSHTCYRGERTKKHEWGYGCGECFACVLRLRGWERFKSYKNHKPN